MRSSHLYRSAGARLASICSSESAAGSSRHIAVVATGRDTFDTPASGSSTMSRRSYARRAPPPSQTMPWQGEGDGELREPRMSSLDPDIDNRWADAPVRKAKKYSKGVFKEAFYNDPADDLPDPQFLAARLRAVLHPPSTSARGSAVHETAPDPYQVLDASMPCTTSSSYQKLLDPHARKICQVLSDHFTRPRAKPETPAVIKAVSEVLAMCFVRTAQMHFDGQRSYLDPRIRQRTDETSDAYAKFVLHQTLVSPPRAADLGRLGTMLDALDQGLTYYKKAGMGYRLTVPLTAAWTVLRTKLGIESQPIHAFIWPRSDEVLQYIERFGSTQGSEYAEGLRMLMTAKAPDLPSTVPELETRLRHIVQHGTQDAAIDLWRRIRDSLGSNSTEEPLPSWLKDPAEKAQALQSTLRALRAAKFGEYPPSAPERIERASDELLSILPKPLSLDVLHTLVANRARVLGVAPEMESGSDVVELVREMDNEDLEYNRKEKALRLLHETWAKANEPGVVRDVKLYMLYLEGLGRLGDLETLRSTWNQMVHDEACKELYFKQGSIDPEDAEDPKAGPLQYPPKRALNQMIQSAIMIPNGGPAVAIELFTQVSTPTASVKCDIFSINILLRHYARLSDLAKMQELLNTADELGLVPDLVTYTILVQGFLRANQMQMAKKTLETMAQHGFEPNERICTILIADCARGGTTLGLKNAEDLLKEMQRRGLYVGVITWTALISGYFRGGWDEDGWDAVRRMEDAGNKLTRPGYNILIARSGAHIDTEILEQPNSIKLFEKMIRDGITPTSETYSSVLIPLVKAKRWRDTDQIVDAMAEMRFVPEKTALRELLKKIKFRRDYNWETPRQREKREAAEKAKRESKY